MNPPNEISLMNSGGVGGVFTGSRCWPCVTLLRDWGLGGDPGDTFEWMKFLQLYVLNLHYEFHVNFFLKTETSSETTHVITFD